MLHELKGSPGVTVFASGKELCLSEAYTRRLPKGQLMMVSGGGLREMVLCEHETHDRITYYWADRATGTLYRARDGKCMSSSRLELEVGR